MTRLVLCAACERHVRSDESACPFCGGSLEGQQPRFLGTTPASRAAALFVGATALVGCGKDEAKKPPEPDPMVTAVAVYGPAVVVPPDATAPLVEPAPPVDAGPPPPPPVPPYGGGTIRARDSEDEAVKKALKDRKKTR